MGLFPWMEVNISCALVLSLTVGVAFRFWEARSTVSEQLSTKSQYSSEDTIRSSQVVGCLQWKLR